MTLVRQLTKPDFTLQSNIKKSSAGYRNTTGAAFVAFPGLTTEKHMCSIRDMLNSEKVGVGGLGKNERIIGADAALLE